MQLERICVQGREGEPGTQILPVPSLKNFPAFPLNAEDLLLLCLLLPGWVRLAWGGAQDPSDPLHLDLGGYSLTALCLMEPRTTQGKKPKSMELQKKKIHIGE